MQMWRQKFKPKKRGKPLFQRLIFACVIILLLITAGILWGLNSEHIIQGDWSTILQIALAIAALILAVVQWLFPFEPKASTDSTPPPPSPINNPAPQPQPSPPTATPQPQPPSPIPQTIPDQIFYFNQQLPEADEFYGRAREHTTLLNRTRNGASTSIVGPRRIGKTWLIDYLKFVAPTELNPNTRLVYLDATAPNCTTLSGFIGEALQELGIPIVDRPSLTLNTLENVVKDLKAKNQSPILCIDEFEGLCNQPGFSLAMLENLRAIANQGLGMVVVSRQSLIETVANILGEPGKTSPFFNIFQQITLKPFTKQEAEDFAQAKSTQAGFTDDERVFLLQYGQEKKQWPPLLLQLAGEMLLRDKNLAAKGSPHYYRPKDTDYRQDFKQRLAKIYHDAGVVIETRTQPVQQKQMKPEDIGRIDNPYRAGQVLKLRDTSFVGRSDLAKQLAKALSRKDHRPTFLLHGERRMGKSSTLTQLPRLLGSHYLPIFYDLQNPGITATIATFLGTLSKEIYSTLNTRGMKVKQLTDEALKDAYKQNEAAVYHEFNSWLDSIERVLEREDRTLLLAFDEFEKLEEGQQGNSIDLRILLNWFRYTIQHRPRLAILFSGVHTISEMGTETGINWASYFVNVKTLHVSFLRVEEARQLITQPVPNFPSYDIFGTGVVDKIISETGCHPFLVQAVCSALIDNLNADKREVAEVQDVTEAVEQVLDSWHNYFSDLWVRTNNEQRVCLAALRTLGQATSHSLAQQSELDEQIVRRTLQTLLKRDLVLRDEDDTYRIAAPIFGEWVERSLLQ